MNTTLLQYLNGKKTMLGIVIMALVAMLVDNGWVEATDHWIVIADVVGKALTGAGLVHKAQKAIDKIK